MISEELKKKIGQMMMCGFPSTFVDDQAKALLKDFYVGNYIYFARNCDSARQTAELSRDLSHMVYDQLGISPIITIDQEGGNVSRLTEGAALISGAAAVSAATDVLDEDHLKKVEDLGENLGRILRACGITINNAPDMDCNIEPANPVIGSRSYGDDPVRVAALAIAMNKGMKKGGVSGAIKHFPGHGNVNADSHLGIPVNNTDMDQLLKTEFRSFELGIRAGAEATMSAHVRYAKIDPEVPGTLSRKIQTELLRERFGFKGISMTDCMEMDAMRKFYPNGEAGVRAIEAGVDLLTVSHTYEAVSAIAKAIYAAVESGRLSEERIDASYQRIMAVKQRMGLMERQNIDPDLAVAETMDAEKQQLADEIALKSQTLLQGSIPAAPDQDWLVVAPPQRASTGAEDMKPMSLTDSMAKRFGAAGLEYPFVCDEAEMASFVEKVDKLIVSGTKKILLGVFNARFRPGQAFLLKEMEKRAAEGKIDLTVVFLGAPYDIALVQGKETVAVTYEYNRLSVEQLMNALEKGQFEGKCPFVRVK